jgi:hypothetical protein
MRNLLLFLLYTFSHTLIAQSRTDELLKSILENTNDSLVQAVVSDPQAFRLQIIYTQIDRDKQNRPSFRNYYFNFDNDLYFNPASTVKLPAAILSLEKLNRIGKKEVNKYTAMQFDSSYVGQVSVKYDSTSETNYPSIAHYIKKAFLVSDNDAYNRMYQFIGQGPFNSWLKEKGYNHTRIARQFMSFSEEQNRTTNPIRFISKDGKVIYSQPAGYNKAPFDFSRAIKVGRAHMNRNDSLVNEPIDFTRANVVGLEDLQRMLQVVLFPESVPKDQRFKLTPGDYKFLYQFLSQYPSETNYPKYDTAEYYDNYVKFYFRDGSHKMPEHVRVFNKVGWAYGFMIDVSYVVDFKNKTEFMLASTIYANSDGILNDNRYDYKQVGWPFLYRLGQAIYKYDLQRKRSFSPDLTRFRIQYEKRDLNDKRKTITGVDN